jgi:hypothetical protein
VRSFIGCLALLHGTLSSAAVAQLPAASTRSAWTFVAQIGTSTFNGAASGTAEEGEQLQSAPHRPTMIGVAVSYGRERLRLGLSARNGDAGLGVRGAPVGGEGESPQGVLIIIEGAYTVTSLAVSASTRIARLRGGPALRSSLGITMERWSAPGTPARTIFGPQVGLSLEIALSGAFAATIDGEVGLTPRSPFRALDLPEGFRERSTWRKTLMAGLSWRP